MTKINKSGFSHLDKKGNLRMVDIEKKSCTKRRALAYGRIYLKAQVMKLLESRKIPKGDVFAAARMAGIMAAKRTDEIIPLCHQLPLEHIDVSFKCKTGYVEVYSEVKCNFKTGAEMEALTSVSIACLTIYDMCKAINKDMIISDICLLEKTGGKSGRYVKNNGKKT
ncbi:cyclic pyranopterin monophosphate synthase MoaC [Elusimicrobiota bacterium]